MDSVPWHADVRLRPANQLNDATIGGNTTSYIYTAVASPRETFV